MKHVNLSAVEKLLKMLHTELSEGKSVMLAQCMVLAN